MKKIDLALQGGGSHGAFTWGVIEKLLQDNELEVGGICGTSAGAMNGTILAYGLHKGGKAEALRLLEEFWKRVSALNNFFGLQPGLYDRILGGGNMDYSPSYLAFDFFTQVFSPYQFNPLDVNPLRELLLELVDFDALRGCHKTRLFVCATNVRRCRAKVFDLSEISVDAVMASACLPYAFKAVTIDGEDYWDGGFMGNPPIFPLIDGTEVNDILIVQVNPIEIKETPKTVVEIRDRINEITFNSSLMLEMRRLNFVQKLLEQGFTYDKTLKFLRIHNINPETIIGPLNFSSKLNTDWTFISYLRALGHKYAEEWITNNKEAVGHHSTCDVTEVFL